MQKLLMKRCFARFLLPIANSVAKTQENRCNLYNHMKMKNVQRSLPNKTFIIAALKYISSLQLQ